MYCLRPLSPLDSLPATVQSAGHPPGVAHHVACLHIVFYQGGGIAVIVGNGEGIMDRVVFPFITFIVTIFSKIDTFVY